jgi:hypothetical protein
MVAGGVGNSQVVLSLSSPGSTSNETGAIMPSGCTGDFQGGCNSANNGLRTFASAGITNAQNVVVYLDAQEPGNDNHITLNSLTLNVYAGSGNSNVPLFSASAPPLDLTVCHGQGNNCVKAFVLDSVEAALLQGIFNSSLRVGLSASFSDATGGPDRMFLSNRQDVGLVVPAPIIGHGLSALLAVGSVLFGASLFRLKAILFVQRSTR